LCGVRSASGSSRGYNEVKAEARAAQPPAAHAQAAQAADARMEGVDGQVGDGGGGAGWGGWPVTSVKDDDESSPCSGEEGEEDGGPEAQGAQGFSTEELSTDAGDVAVEDDSLWLPEVSPPLLLSPSLPISPVPRFSRQNTASGLCAVSMGTRGACPCRSYGLYRNLQERGSEPERCDGER
jgi:hypothetical protein